MMTTTEFLEAILPAGGTYFLAVIKNGKTIHHAFTDFEAMSQAIETLSQSTKQQVYFACAAYQQASVQVIDDKTGNPKAAYRVQENCLSAKAFWLDLDCGAEKAASNAGYLTKKEAASALWKFCADIGWPKPLLIDSGGGLHCYWLLTEAVDPDTWRVQASLLKAATHHFGLLADDSRTADFASILRPPGSFNRKKDPAKPVKVKHIGEPHPPQTLFDALSLALPPEAIPTLAPANFKAAPQAGAMDGLNDDLLAHLPMRLDSSGDLVADQCKQLSDMRASCGDAPFKVWWGVLGVLKQCVDGQELAARWTSRRQETGHDKFDWADETANWKADATTCQYFESNHPTGCAECPHKGLVTSPIQLGRIVPPAQVIDIPHEPIEGAADAPTDFVLPKGFVINEQNYLCRVVTAKNGEHKVEPFCSHVFYLTYRVRVADGRYRIGGVMLVGKEQKPRKFECATEALSSDNDLLRALAYYELTRSKHHNSGVNMAAYMREQFDQLKRMTEEINTFERFGWHDDNNAFLLGDQLYLRDGTIRQVHLSPDAKLQAESVHAPRGTLQGYAQGLNTMYNRPGMEHYQYMICAGWGSILTPMGQDLYHGILLAIVGGKSSKGKSTVCNSAMRAFGSPAGMRLDGKDGATLSRRYSTFATLGSLPVLLDEIGGYEDKEVSDLAYAVSLGSEKKRMTSQKEGVRMVKAQTWDLTVYATGNRDFYGALAINLANSEAEAMRLIQISIDDYPVVRNTNTPVPYEFLSEVEKKKVDNKEQGWINGHVELMKANEGCAGAAMVQYVVTHYDEVKAEVRRIAEELCDTVSDSRFRFFRDQFACALTIGRIAKELEIIAFDMDQVEAYVKRLFADLYSRINEEITQTPADLFNAMMTAMRERIVVTDTMRDGRSAEPVEIVNHKVRGELVGRYINPSSKIESAGHLILIRNAASAWCTKNRVNIKDIEKFLESHDALLVKNEKKWIYRGTDITKQQPWCMVIDTKKLELDLTPTVKDGRASETEVD